RRVTLLPLSRPTCPSRARALGFLSHARRLNPMSRLLSLSIRTQLFLMALIVAVPASGLIVYSGVALRRTAIEGAVQETATIASRIVDQQEHSIAAAEQLMSALAQLPDLRNRNAVQTQKIL